MTVSVGTEKHRGTFEEKLAQPNVFKAEVMVFENRSTHLEGEITAKELVVLSDTFTTGSPQDEMQSTEESQSSSVGINLITRMPVLSMGQSESQTQKTKHKLTKINAENIFIRVDDMVVSGTQIRAKLVDAVIKKSLTIESLLDTFHQTRESVSLSTTGDFRVGDEEIVKKTINAIASFIGTEQFYLEVGGTLLTRSGEFGLKPDGVIAPHVKTEQDKTLYIRKMPTFQNTDGFFALLDHTGTKHPRQDAVKLLLDNASDESIRTLVSSVITGEEVLTLPGALALYKAYGDAEENLEAMVQTANTALNLSGKTAQQLMDLDPDETDPRLDLVRETFGILNEVKDRLTTWSKNQATFEAFIKDIVAKPGYALKPNGLMQAIAKLSGRNLIVYQDQGGTAKPIHTYTNSSSTSTLAILLTKDNKGDHFALLEDTVTKVNAKEIKREYLEETDKHDGFILNMPLGTMMTFMGQLDELKAMQTHVYEELVDEGVTTEEAMGVVEQFENMDDIIETALAPKPKPKEKAPSLLSEEDVKSWAKVFVKSVDEEDGLHLSPTQQKQLTLGLAKKMLERHQFWMKKEGLTDQQAWVNVRFELIEFMKSDQTQPNVNFVVFRSLLKGSKVALQALGKFLWKTKQPTEELTQKMKTVGQIIKAKTGKGVKKGVEKSGKEVHKNSAKYVGECHKYAIRDRITGKVHKIGQSGKGYDKFGRSKRAEIQVRKFRKITGKDYYSEIREVFPTKRAVLDSEKKTIVKFRGMYGKDQLPGNKGNH